MTLSILLAASLAATPSPRAIPSAQAAIHFPRLDRLGGVLAFMDHAGDYAVTLRPANWRGEFLPLLQVDPTRAESLTSAGIDPAGPATVSVVGEAEVTCVTLHDPKAFEARARQSLEGRGQPWKGKAQGLALTGIQSGKEVVAGYVVRGTDACVVEGVNADGLLQQAAAQLVRPAPGAAWKNAAGLPGVAYIVTSRGTVGVDGDADRLRLEGRSARLPLPPVRTGSPSPYAAMRPSGLLFLRALLEPSAIPQALGALEYEVSQACPSCDRSKMAELSRALAPTLTGHVLMRVDRVQPGTTLRTPSGRYFAVKHAFLAEVTRPEEAQAALAQVASWSNARKTGDGYAIPLPEGEIALGLHGNQLYLGNDAEAMKAALDGLGGAPGKLPHGAEYVIDPRQVARALARIPLLEAISSRELAPLLALSTELGPLFGASESLTGWADSAGPGAHRFSLDWKMPR